MHKTFVGINISSHTAALLIITRETLVFTICWNINSTDVRWQVLFRPRVSLKKWGTFIMIKNELRSHVLLNFTLIMSVDRRNMQRVTTSIILHVTGLQIISHADTWLLSSSSATAKWLDFRGVQIFPMMPHKRGKPHFYVAVSFCKPHNLELELEW